MVVDKCVCYFGEILECRVEGIYYVNMKWENLDLKVCGVFNDIFVEMDRILFYGIEE